MSMRNITSHVVSPKVTPQTEAIPGREADMAKNNAGGVTFVLDKWAKLSRFLVLGSEGGTFYATEKTLTKLNSDNSLACIGEDGLRVVKMVVDISDAGRAPSNTPALFVLALAAKLGDDATRKAAFEAMPKVARIGTHLFEFAQAIDSVGGWGRATRTAFSNWYKNRKPDSLAMQLIKYQSRGTWSHRDVLRLSKPSGHEKDSEIGRLLGWATNKWSPDLTVDAPTDGTRLIWAHEKAKSLGQSIVEPGALGEALAKVKGSGKKAATKEIVDLINAHGLPRESIPTNALNEPEVWEALLHNRGDGMPITALIRNLGKMTSIGVLSQGTEISKKVASRLADPKVLKDGRVHPMSVLIAHRTYARGAGTLGSLSWKPVSKISDALDSAFYAAFGAVDPSGKRTMLALDVSGSMGGAMIGKAGLNCREASAAMAMITAAVEDEVSCFGFSTSFIPLDISPRRRLDDNIRAIANLPFAGTDCALPMIHAKKNKMKIDTFIVYTDSETWAGGIQPVQALKQYRDAMGIPAKLIVVGMAATEFTIADPKDPGMLDVVGFDTNAPNVMSAFSRGDF